MARKQQVVLPSSKIKFTIANILKENGYVGDVKEEGDNKKELTIKLIYKDSKAVMSSVKRISKPGRRIYAKSEDLSRVLSGYGMSIVSTSSGIMTGKDAKKKKIGGEIICEIY